MRFFAVREDCWVLPIPGSVHIHRRIFTQTVPDRGLQNIGTYCDWVGARRSCKKLVAALGGSGW